MDVKELKLGTVGEIIVLDVGILIEGDEVATVTVLKPDDTTTSWAATPVAGSETITYTLAEGDLDQLGNWYLVPVVDGVKGETARIRVIDEFD